MGYSKLHSSIVGSSLWNEPDPVRILFITLLAISGPDGSVYGSKIGLGRIANIRKEDIEQSFATLLAPDPNSCDLMRFPDNEGRRIEEIAGGFRLLNYDYYRNLRNDDDRREQTREAVRRHRERGKITVTNGNQEKASEIISKPSKPVKAQAEAEAEAEERTKPSRKQRTLSGIQANPSEVSKGVSESRHARIHGMIMRAYLEQNGIECPWNGADGKQLKIFLDKTPHWTDQQIAQCLMNLYASEGFPKSTEPKEFLTYLPKYLKSPLDQFKNSIGVKHESKQSTGAKRITHNAAVFSAAIRNAHSDIRDSDLSLPRTDGTSGTRILAEGIKRVPGEGVPSSRKNPS